MILNTLDLNTDETHRLMKIGCKSGMYEIVMYSEVKYFAATVLSLIDTQRIRLLN